jgi:hypothetical protein
MSVASWQLPVKEIRAIRPIGNGSFELKIDNWPLTRGDGHINGIRD